MKLPIITIAIALLVAACSSETAEILDERDTVRSLTDLALAGMPAGTKVLAQCGGSEGHAAYELPDGTVEWGEDGMPNGMIVIVEYPDGTFDVLSRDATDIFSKISDYGGEVEQIYVDDSLGRKSFVVSLPDGAIQSFQLVPLRKASKHWAQSARLYWSQTKPGGDVLLPSTFAFIADCY